jgi:hypothetical protein
MATLTVTHTESLNLNGADRGSTKSLTIDSVTTVYETVFPLSTTSTNILQFATAVEGASSFKLDVENIKYMRFTNLDATNDIYLSFGTATGDADHFAINISPGETFLTSSPDDYMDVVIGGAVAYSFADVLSISAKTSAGTASLEVFAAGA